ncbi:hypothetical protein EPUS_04444 [Endocarpon pusillum Z07020]|uniref:Methyltransferase domain-containing protein n=1 Tax=Endocarpon pusillum (strain Z07020 / HMAS-L-300199) TaxID=1263415 RepID=U1I3M4_ENDPU|nr:uncharacterized protein EPUS_04444 [Endocarpon pusillum Z07020]ERF76624.1 hypothetical protein EPUS_04444 [Endocarpon pusillum Z07020]
MANNDSTRGSDSEPGPSSATVDFIADSASNPLALEIDWNTTDNDSAYGDEVSTYTSSITSSVMDFPEIEGRRYHAYRQGRYALPNDEEENERLDIHHALIYTAMEGRLFYAPIGQSPQRVLDIATGTGIWAMDFADEFPSAEVLGNDLSPTQPTLFVHQSLSSTMLTQDSVPPNLEFIVDDVEDEWGYEHQPFDFIHARFLAGAIRDWPKLMRQALDCTKPGGWVEFQDWDTFLYSADNSMPLDSAINRFHQMSGGAREAMGYSMCPGRHLQRWMTDAGFINISCTKILLPLGTWAKNRQAKKIGAYNLLQMQQGLEGILLGTLPHAKPRPWSKDEIMVFLADIRKDFQNPKIHGQYDL